MAKATTIEATELLLAIGTDVFQELCAYPNAPRSGPALRSGPWAELIAASEHEAALYAKRTDAAAGEAGDMRLWREHYSQARAERARAAMEVARLLGSVQWDSARKAFRPTP